MKINWLMFITGIVQFGAGVVEIVKGGNVALALVYLAYGFAACALSTV